MREFVKAYHRNDVREVTALPIVDPYRAARKKAAMAASRAFWLSSCTMP